MQVKVFDGTDEKTVNDQVDRFIKQATSLEILMRESDRTTSIVPRSQKVTYRVKIFYIKKGQ